MRKESEIRFETKVTLKAGLEYQEFFENFDDEFISLIAEQLNVDESHLIYDSDSFSDDQLPDS